ncbi:hypothetical protein PVK06_026390 [Gossypium arboreum]|uniref:Uncharacterized protein n=1 Tax=Gossypium arboreum TaxID=29729 RepID=A0ABR0NXI7_GOSAR|nr:hypothetical protein PVK06_026390 [Gossypium arboreum]
MARIRGSGLAISNNPSQYRETRNVVKAKAYVYTIKEEEMHQVLVVRGIKIPNFTYDFSIPKGSHYLNDTSTTQGVKDSFEESTNLSIEIDEYMDVRSYMQSLRGGLPGATTRDSNASNRKKQSFVSGAANIVLSSEDKGSPRAKLRRKRRGDHTETSVNVAHVIIASFITPSTVISPINSLQPARSVNDDAFEVTITYCPLVAL